VDAKQLARAATTGGWRKALADRLSPALARRTRWSADDVRAALGLLYLASTLRFLVRTIRRYRQ